MNSLFLWGASFGMISATVIFILGIYYERLRKIRADRLEAGRLAIEQRLAQCEAYMVEETV